jgi:hypothetical protein
MPLSNVLAVAGSGVAWLAVTGRPGALSRHCALNLQLLPTDLSQKPSLEPGLLEKLMGDTGFEPVTPSV